MSKIYLTEEENLIDQATPESARITSGDDFDNRKKMMEKTAKNTKKQRISVSIKIPEAELAAFKQSTSSEGLKYQTKLNQLIYLYNRNLLVHKRS